MIKPDMIPKECFVAYQRAFKRGGGVGDAIAAALNAWPGVKPHEVQVPDDTSDDIRYVLKTVGIILPLPQGSRDE